MGANTSKGEPATLKENNVDDEFEDVGRYHGSCKNDKRHGQGVYYYNNGDIYDGEWRKGRKEGRGTYVFANGKKNVGWFYRDDYVGKEPNEKLKRKMRKKRMLYNDAEELVNNDESSVKSPTSPTSPTTPTTHDSYSDDEDSDIPKLKDTSNLDLRRAESMRRQKYFRAKYNIPDRKEPEEMKQESRGLRDSIRAKWGLKRSKSTSDGSSKSSKVKDPKFLTKEEELLERENSRRQRESIRARYNLH